ncbi:2S seed storage protein-like [Cynara cardunculus var. scolymus]|uniref:2S seed storage protein-like n=1 Tax=Cynara cardunculus var. scolymus TaxID=59895 RepID=UPI000D629510|nr:2S seed storage protein-like [Cynara cardunculus var. scolymus]
MAKLIVLAFTIATLLAFASAHRTIITTTIEDDTFDINTSSRKDQCMQHLQSQQLQQCQRYLQQPNQSPFGLPNPQQQQALQQCCQELRNIDEQCACKAVKQAFGEVQQQQQQQQQQAGPFGSQQTQQLKQKAENLPNVCNVQTRQQCNVKTVKQCRNQVQQAQQFNRCQKYLEQQAGSGYLRTVVSLEKQPQEVEQCCEELRNVDVECQCEAMKEVYNQAQREQQRPQMEQLGRMVQNLKNECNLEVEQCQVPSWRF